MFENMDLPVNTVRAKPSNRDSETHKRYMIYLNSKHYRDLKFGMYFPCVAFNKFDATILKIFRFGQLTAKKTTKKWRPLYWNYDHIMAKKQNFQICGIPHRESTFQIP